MSETELERLVVRLTGDASEYQAMLQQAQTSTKQAGRITEESAGHMEQGLHGVRIGARDARHALHLLSVVTPIGREHIHEVILAVHAYHLFEHKLKPLIGMLFSLKGALAATGIGLAVTGVIMAVQWFSKMREEAKKVNEGVTKALEGMASGGKTISEALSEVKIAGLTEQLKEIVPEVVKLNDIAAGKAGGAPAWFPGLFDAMNRLSPELFQSAAEASVQLAEEQKKLVNEKIAKSLKTEATMLHAYKEAVKDAGVQHILQAIAVEKATVAADKEAEKLEQEADRLGMSADAAKRYAMVQELAARLVDEHTDKAQALAKAEAALAPQLYRVGLAQAQLLAKGPAEKVKDLADSLAKMKTEAAAGSIEAELLGIKLDWKRKGIDFKDHIADLYLMRKALTEIEGIKLEKTAQELDNQARAASMAGQKAREFALEQKYLAAGLTMTEDARKRFRVADTAIAISAVMKDVGTLSDEIDRQREAMKNGADAAERLGIAQKFARDQGITLADAQRELQGPLQRTAELQDESARIKIFEDTRRPTEQLQKRMTELNRLFEGGKKDPELYGRAVAKAKEEFGQATTQIEKFDAVMSGSLESLERRERQKELFKGIKDLLPQPFVLPAGMPGQLPAGAGEYNTMASKMFKRQVEAAQRAAEMARLTEFETPEGPEHEAKRVARIMAERQAAMLKAEQERRVVTEGGVQTATGKFELEGNDKQTDLLQQIRDILRGEVKKPGMEIEPAGVS